jgi:hypothetical protein
VKRDYPPRCHDEGNGVLPLVGEADGPLGQAQLGRPLRRPSVQVDLRAAPPVPQNLHLVPLHPVGRQDAHPDSQRFGDGLLGRKPRRQFRRPSPAVDDLRRGEDPAQEALPVPLQRPLHAGDRDQVHPDGQGE